MSPPAASGGSGPEDASAASRASGTEPGSGAADAADRGYRRALARHGLRDVQPGYRALLLRLKQADPEAYEAAVARYTGEVAPRAAAAEADPLEVWIEYGMWLARRLHPGKTLAVDGTGRADAVEGRPPLGPLILHLPKEKREKAIALAVPETPTGPQRATVELLCG